MTRARPLLWIVDDSLTQAAVAERMLGTTYDYELFLDGESAIERLSSTPVQHRPDLILLDWVLPGLSGDEVCRYLRAIPDGGDIAIIIVTASRTETSGIVSSLASGANDYLTKPFSQAELCARVGSLLRAAALKSEATRERRRLSAMNQLATAVVAAGNGVQAVLDAVSAWLTDHLADACFLSFACELRPSRTSARHRDPQSAVLLASLADCAVGDLAFATMADAQSKLPTAFHPYLEANGVRAAIVRRVELAELGTWTVVLVRDAEAPPFGDSDLVELEQAIDYCRLAIESAARADNDRSTARFHQEMLGIVSHDLRTPLTAFVLGLELMDSEDLTQEELAKLRARDVGHPELVDDALHERAELDARPRDLDPGPEARPRHVEQLLHDPAHPLRAAPEATRTGTGRQASFEVTGAEVEGDWDGPRLEQVFANLAGNAVQYGRANTPIRISITSTASTADVVVHNENRGAPIPAATLASFFDPFLRGTSSGNADGLGLGLYISSEITKAHHGVIAVTSDTTGTSFRVTLPLSP